ncbi:U-box domain-containing protein 33-like isoform X2 [Setaria viridis]|uniref:RING-type E3 ubiquitin transferase n=2 Tax=Setaria viridis TaxID=4556 RepID=A0A4U6WF41_SETVI|nr:hypothetical protein SEVIR_1G269300v2 [Setaria viridis]
MEERGGGEHEAWEQPLWSARGSPATSSAGSLADEPDDDAEDKVFVAVPEDVGDGRSTLLWALHNLVRDGSEVVIVHVHSPARAIARMRDHTSMKPEEIKEYRKLKRAKAEKNLNAYVQIAKRTREDIEVGCEKVIIEMDNVAQGLEELIILHNITELVMGAAADQHFSKEMNTPKSKTALKLMETAVPSCKIWFTCKGHLICTREATESLPAILPSPAKNAPMAPAYSISSQMGSMAPAELEYEVSSSKGYTSSSLVATEMTDWDYLFGVYGSSRIDAAANFSGTAALPPIIGDANELTPVLHSPTQESDNVYLLLESAYNQEDEPSVDEEMYGKLQDLCSEAKLLLDQADDKSHKIGKAEMDLHSALERIKESEDSYLQEVSQRKEIEKTFARQRLQIEEMRRRLCTLSDELQDSKKYNLMLEQRITQIKSAAKDHVEEITEYFIKQSCEESKKCQKIEMDLLSTLQRVKEVESLLQNEKAQREYMEEKIARQRTEIEETKRQRDKLYYDFQDAKEQRIRLEQVDASEETNRRRKAERDMLSYLQRIKDLENQQIRQLKKQETMEETMARQKEEIQATKRKLHEIHGKHMAEIKSAVKVHEEKDANSKQLFQELQVKYDKLLHERDTAVIEAKELRQKNKQSASVTNETPYTGFSFVELQKTTNGFDAEFKISEDGFASIYKGFIRNTNVAIKLFHPRSLKGQAKFYQEVAVLSRVRHPNLVTLMGACPDDFALVYEFLPNGSLEDWLSCKKHMPPLTWKVRTRIIGEICSALAFIHSHKPYPIVHGDLNLGNILLDANFVSKVGDLGICHLLRQPDLPTTNLQHHPTKNHKGTLCCMDNGEFKSARELMLWSDVNSFGIIILRLLTGRSKQQIGEIVEEAMEKGNLHSIIDASAGDWPLMQANQMAQLGLRCITLSWGRQPNLAGEVWVVIEQLMKAACLPTGPSRFASPSDAPPPSHFICPIFQEVMSDPHMAADGFTYEAEAIRGWLDAADTSPMTNLRLANRTLTPNKALRSAILEWQQQQNRR